MMKELSSENLIRIRVKFENYEIVNTIKEQLIKQYPSTRKEEWSLDFKFVEEGSPSYKTDKIELIAKYERIDPHVEAFCR